MTTTSIQDELYAIDAAMTRPLDCQEGQLLADLCCALDKMHWTWRYRQGLVDDGEDEAEDWGQPSATLEGLVLVADEATWTAERQ